MQVSQLTVYPIKSGAGLALEVGELDRFGLLDDRRFMVVDASGNFLTQREQPGLATVSACPVGDHLDVTCAAGQVTVDLTIPGEPVSVAVWEHHGPALDCGSAVADLLSDHLNTPCRLVRLSPNHNRPIDDQYAAGQVSFADGYPLLIIGQASLADLNSRLDSPLPMNRFRPNVVIADSAPYAEDDWTRIRIGSVELDVVKPCARCAITTVDQATGTRDGAEPLRTLGTFRRGPKGVLFGMNAVHRTRGSLRTGDRVEVLSSPWQPEIAKPRGLP